MMEKKSVFLEPSVLKFSADRLERWAPRPNTVEWGGRKIAVDVCKPVTLRPNQELTNQKLRAETEVLPSIADLARKGQIELLTHIEALWEFWGLPKTDAPHGRFYGALIRTVDGPIQYGRIILSGLDHSSGKQLQLDFLREIRHERFLQLQKACGAYQGSRDPAPNQLLDAFHVWCAESAGADLFLTCDLTLIRTVRSHKRFPPKVELVKPSELLERNNGESQT